MGRADAEINILHVAVKGVGASMISNLYEVRKGVFADLGVPIVHYTS